MMTLHNDKILNHPEKENINLLLLTQRYRWKAVNFPNDQKYWKKLERKKKNIPLNVFLLRTQSRTKGQNRKKQR